jgi:cell division FtsZ-interacting protein ZapD
MCNRHAGICLIFQAKATLTILKRVDFQENVAGRKADERALEALKADITSASVALTAANYFGVNKYLLTSVRQAFNIRVFPFSLLTLPYKL